MHIIENYSDHSKSVSAWWWLKVFIMICISRKMSTCYQSRNYQWRKDNDLLMLLHSPTKWYIISFSISPQRMKQKNGIFVAHFKKSPSGVGHEQSMTIVNRITQLECKYCICISPCKFFTELSWGKTVLIETIIILYWLNNFQVSSYKPVSRISDRFLNIRQPWGCCSPGSRNSFFFIVLVDLNTELKRAKNVSLHLLVEHVNSKSLCRFLNTNKQIDQRTRILITNFIKWNRKTTCTFQFKYMKNTNKDKE